MRIDVSWRPGECRPRLARPVAVTPGDEAEFQHAVEAYKVRSGRNFPTCCEVLEVIRSLGYAKRIWEPVGTWSPTPTGGPGAGGDSGANPWVVGWFSQVETSSSL